MSERLHVYRHPLSIALVAIHEDCSVAGLDSGHLIALMHQAGNLGRITIMVVYEDSRGDGVGTLLIKALENWFDENQCLRYEVTSGDHRAIAHQFYENSGYQSDERRFVKVP